MKKLFTNLYPFLFILILGVYLSILLNQTGQYFQPNFPNDLITFMGFFLTALGFIFIVVQMFFLNKQINNQEEQYHKDSEFKNFLEATKMLTSMENKDNPIAQMSAMYLLYDFAKKYPANNLEKIMRVLNKYAMLAIYQKSSIFTPEKSNSNNIISDKKTINEWKENGEPHQKSAITALELNKKLFIYAIEHKIKTNLSDIIIFDFDIEKDFDKKISDILINKKNLSDIVGYYSQRIIFLHCYFSYDSKQFDFSTGHFYSRWFLINRESIKNRVNISLSYFIECDLTKCDFSYSNLWGVVFKNCNLKGTRFQQAECEGSEFIGESKLSEKQLEEMLFIDEKHFKNFRSALKYGIVYSKNESFFNSREEYEKFFSYKNKAENKSEKTKDGLVVKAKQFICKKCCQDWSREA